MSSVTNRQHGLRARESATRPDNILKKVREYFQEVDRNNDNQLSRVEFTQMVNSIGMTGLDVSDLRRAYDHADTDQSGSISFREFLDAYATYKLNDQTESDLNITPELCLHYKPEEKSSVSEEVVLRRFREYFRELDVNGDNMLSAEEFTRMVSMVGMDLDVDELKKAYERVDRDGSGSISFKEFLDCYKTQISTSEIYNGSRISDGNNTRRKPNRHSKDFDDSLRKSFSDPSTEMDVIKNGCSYFWNSDKDNDGKSSLTEFSTMIQALGMKLNQRDIAKAFRAADVDGSGCMHFGEYMRAYLVKITTSLTNAKIKDIFQKHDIDRKGYLLREEFRCVMRMLGNVNVDERGLEKLMFSATRSNQGMRVSWKNLCDLLGIQA